MYEGDFPNKRYRHTLEFLQEAIPPPAEVLDLGVRNPFSEQMEKAGYSVTNTLGQDLDFHPKVEMPSPPEVVTAFEIFEHLLNPFQVLQNIEAKKLVATVPLRLWFSSAYRSRTDKWDRHFHEFEDWQFDWLLEKTGWAIKMRHKWNNPIRKLGFRPLLRNFTPRYYAVYAERTHKSEK